MSDESANSPQEGPQEPEKTFRPPRRLFTRQEKIRYLLIGFLGWWLVNVPLYLLLDRVPEAGGLFPFVFLLNVLVLIVMAAVNRWVALGLVAAIALNLVISLFLGLFFNVLCWIPFTTPAL